MLYLGKNNADKHTYITTIIDNGETFSIKFADGTVYTGYENNEENLKTVIDIMELQAQEAKDDKMYFESKGAKTIISTLAGTTLAALIVEELGANILNSTFEQIIITTGATIIIGLMTGSVFAYINAEKLKEIEKLELRSFMREDLENISDYPHALLGVRKSLAEFIRNSKAPFSIINSDHYTTEDLRKINKNISREKVYCKQMTKKETD